MNIPGYHDVIRAPAGSGGLYAASKPAFGDLPAPGWERVSEEQMQAEDSAAHARSQETDTVLRRLTSTEYAALHAAKAVVPAIDLLVIRSASTGVISEADPDFPAAKNALHDNGIILESRWDGLFAP